MRTFARILLPILLLTMLALPVAADATCVIALSAATLTQGDTLTVTVTFAGGTVGAVDATLSYDPAVLQFNSGENASGGGGVVRIAGYAISEVDQLRFALNFTALAAGSTRVTVESSAVFSWDEQLAGNPTAGVNVTVQDKALSQNADLKSITLSAGRLSPAFSAANTVYTVTVENAVTAVNISAVPADDEAKVAISGSAQLAVGENVRTVTVTAPAGNTKTYTITLIRQTASVTTTTRPTTTQPSATTTGGTTTTTAPPSPQTFTWQGAAYTVGDPAAHPLPAGFEVVGTVAVGGEELPCALDAGGNITLLHLTDEAGDEGWYVFREAASLLAPYTAVAVYGHSYLLLPRIDPPVASMQPVTREVAGVEWDGYREGDLEDFTFIYAMNEAGEIGWYTWDTAEGTLQRLYFIDDAPETETVPAETTTTTVITTTTTQTPANVTTAPPSLVSSLRDDTLPWLVAGALGLVSVALAVLLIIFRRRETPQSDTAPRH